MTEIRAQLDLLLNILLFACRKVFVKILALIQSLKPTQNAVCICDASDHLKRQSIATEEHWTRPSEIKSNYQNVNRP